MPDQPLRLVYMGTPDFAVPPLRALIETGYTPVGVVTAPDRKSGRGQTRRSSAVKQVAESVGIQVLQPESLRDEAFVKDLDDLEVDVIVVVAFKILPPEVYTLAKKGAFNLHASLLPAFRGAAPIQRALMTGVKKTGVTTFFLKPKVDTGDMILQDRIEVGPNETGGELHDRLAELGARAVVETVRRIEAGKADSTPQNDTLASSAPKIFKEDMQVDWSLSSKQIHDHIRALSPYPAAWTMHEGEPFKLFRAAVLDDALTNAKAGTILEASERIVVACGQGAVEILELQRGGKRRMNGVDFLNGYSLSVGDVLV